MKYKGIIFDFNGVLLWDADFHFQAWQATALRLRGSEMSGEEFATHVHGRTNSHILRYLTGRTLQGRELFDLAQIKELMYQNLCLKNPDRFALSPGATALLDFVVENGIPRTIATASEKNNVDFFAQHLDLEKWFGLQHIVYDDGFLPGKPAPDMYAKAAANLYLPPDACIVVEDSFSGFKSAHAAGIGHIVGLGPRETHDKLLACEGVSTVIESFEEFPRELLEA
ncbi:HAD family phosphatase [Candidatus Methylospira mobilis]|uniref:HAD family phosphatase n=1 Tax=Candidatus Methylospira mobilis TaxID=1808979 RepID=A0A5Q0BHM7_9GAMM|nr:HAD family phosphatase [Candidatus Methylospira mobilis]QFY43330.1 HAD family phosphatase [Candidatus Methylospira mobilis]WNV03454.1 HAD family phosphatase [Candidatus Methylospira mobilis]